jgi:hypothetical protein
MSPRRWGKTSLVNRVAQTVKEKELVIVKMDIFACRSEYDFYNTFSSEILKQTSSRIDEKFVEKICSTVDYQASYVQQLSYSVFLFADREVTDDSFARAVKDLTAQNSSVFIEQTQSLTTYQLNYLKAVMDGIRSGYGDAQIRETYNLGSPSNITRLKNSMVEKELVELTEDGVIIGDPVLKLWLSDKLL